MTSLEITEDDISNLETELEHLTKPKIIFDQSRRHAIINNEDVQACPGSGKTTMVAAKLILVAKKWTETRRGICVLTHTNVAVEEILKLLLVHPSGHKLQTYPHFVGTIQEFVNRFLGLPYLRSKYEFKRFSENNEAKLEVNRAKAAGFAIDELCRKLYRRCNRANYQVIEEYLSTLFYVNKSFDLGFFGQNGILIPTQAANRSDTYVLLETLKETLNQAGIFQFRDMYVFAEKLRLSRF
jgi:DNA helicase-2/ATP-dependent DNA helicase PcrA